MLEILEFIPLRFSWILPFLNIVGYLIKHKTRVNNGYIPVLLFILASSSSGFLRYITSVHTGWYFWFDILFVYGIVNGLKLSLIACGGYEAVRNIRTAYKMRTGGKMLKEKPFVIILIAFLVATLIFGLLSFVFGEDIWGIFTKLTDGWIFGTLFMLAFDITKRLVVNKETITKTYIAMVVLIVLNVISFFAASYARDIEWLIAGVACAVVFGVAAGILPTIINRIKAKRSNLSNDGKNTIEAGDIQNEWVKIRAKLIKASSEKQKKEMLYSFLAFKLKDDSIYNELDLKTPLIKVGDYAMTVNSASKNTDVSSELIEQAKLYIDKIV